MQHAIDTLVRQFEQGRLTRRQLVQGLLVVAASPAVAPSKARIAILRFDHCPKASVSGRLEFRPSSFMRRKTGDSASFSGIFVHGGSVTICERYTGNNTGAEPVATGSGTDGTYCLYAKSDIVLR